MAQQIIDQSDTRARWAYAQKAPWAEAVRETGFMFADAVQRYNDKLEAENKLRLETMTAMGTKVGFNKLGPDFMMQYEKLSGVKFPRDEKGMPHLPPTLEEQIEAQAGPYITQAMNSPRGRELVLGMMGLTKKPLSDSELALESYKANSKIAYNNQRLALEAMRTNAQILKAETYAKNYGKGGSGSRNAAVSRDPSGWMTDPENPYGLPIPYVEGQGKEMTRGQLQDHYKRINAGQAERRLDNQELKSAFSMDSRLSRDFIAAGNAWERSRDPQFKASMFKVVQNLARQANVPIEDKPESWFARWWKDNKKDLGTMQPVAGAAAGAIQGVTTPPMQGPRNQIAQMSDADLEALIRQRLADGMSRDEIYKASGESMRVLEMFSRMPE